MSEIVANTRKAEKIVTVARELPRNSASVDTHVSIGGRLQDAWEDKLNSDSDSDSQDKNQDLRQPQRQEPRSELDNRYGKIGISAVAAAVRHQGGQRTVTAPRVTPYDRD